MMKTAKNSESGGQIGIDRLSRSWLLALFMVMAFWPLKAATADDVMILDATTEVQTNGLYAFSVTLQHADEGWSHYADRWEVIGENGTVLGERILFHPHENNVPFTRSLASVNIPIGTLNVTIRANCSVDGVTAIEYPVALPPR